MGSSVVAPAPAGARPDAAQWAARVRDDAQSYLRRHYAGRE